MDGVRALIDGLLGIRSEDRKAFHEAARAAIADGVLTEREMRELENMKEEFRLTDSALGNVRMELYTEAFETARDDAVITEEEWDELQRIQNFLGLSDADIHRTKKELYRLRIMSEMKSGNLPIIDVAHVVLKPAEVIHWREPVTVFTRKSGNVVISNEGKEFSLMPKAWTEEGSGELVLTSKRLIIKGDASRAFPLSQILEARYFINGILLHVNRRKSLFLRYKEKGNHNIVGSILAHVLHATNLG